MCQIPRGSTRHLIVLDEPLPVCPTRVGVHRPRAAVVKRTDNVCPTRVGGHLRHHLPVARPSRVVRARPSTHNGAITTNPVRPRQGWHQMASLRLAIARPGTIVLAATIAAAIMLFIPADTHAQHSERPPAPPQLQAEPDAQPGRARLTWSEVPDAVAYQAWYAPADGPSGRLSAKVIAPQNEQVIYGLQNNTEYRFHVMVKVGADPTKARWSLWSAPAAIRTPARRPVRSSRPDQRHMRPARPAGPRHQTGPRRRPPMPRHHELPSSRHNQSRFLPSPRHHGEPRDRTGRRHVG